MSMDRTLKTRGGLTRSRSVLTRSERVARLIDEGKFDLQTGCPLGLPKVRVRHSKAGMKTKKAVEPTPAPGAEAAAAEAAPGAAPAGGAAKAAAPKGAAPKLAAPKTGAKQPAPAKGEDRKK